MEEPPEKTYRLLKKGEEFKQGDEAFLGVDGRWSPVAIPSITSAFFNPKKHNPIRRQINGFGADVASHDITVCLVFYRDRAGRPAVCTGCPPNDAMIIQTKQINVTFEENT